VQGFAGEADLSTVVTGLEMYCVDTNHYPTYHYVVNARSTSGYSFHVGGLVNELFQSPPFLGPTPPDIPISYLTQFPRDVFGTRNPGEPGEAGDFYYVNWGLRRRTCSVPAVFCHVSRQAGSFRLHSNGTRPRRPGFRSRGEQIDYDPTNGIVSVGDIYRAKKSRRDRRSCRARSFP